MKSESTKKAASLNLKWHLSAIASLDEAYPSGCSADKRAAERNILSEMREANGYDYRILSKNTFQFSCGYVYVDSEGKPRLRCHTASHKYDVPYMTMAEIYKIIK